VSGAGALESALLENRRAHEAYVQSASAIPPEAWDRPAAAGKWSPGEITEHLRLSLDALERELRGETGIAVRVSGWKQVLLRHWVLPRMLRTRRFPAGVRAPRETRPATPDAPPAEALRRLAGALDRFEKACAAQPRPLRRLTHPYFGALTLPRFHRLLALHTLHHRAQLPPGPWKN
jgi:hypothetical protein